MGKENTVYLVRLLAFGALAVATWMYRSPEPPAFANQIEHAHGPHGADEHVEEGLLPHGPHGGMLFEDRDLAIELVRHEHEGTQWLYAYPLTENKQPLALSAIKLTVTFSNNGLSETLQLHADSNESHSLAGQLPEDALRGWQLTMLASHEQHAHQWRLENFIDPS